MVYRKNETRKKEIYGITGLKEHGKDTFANLIVGSGKVGTSFRIVHFADSLKNLVMTIFNLTKEDVFTLEGKERLFSIPIVIDTHLETLKKVTGLEITAHEMIARNPRELLQYVGSEYIRNVDRNYWLNQIRPELTKNRRLLIPDVRFPNEAEIIRENEGKIIRIIRIDRAENIDTHSSELEGLKIEADLVLGVRTGDLSLVERVAYLLAMGKWDSAMRYDYRRIKTALDLYQKGEPLIKCVNAIGVKNDDSQAFRVILAYYGVSVRRPGIVTNPHRFNDGKEEKQCSTCKEWKDLGLFNKNAKSWDFHHCLCQSCASQYHKIQYLKYEKELSFKQILNQARQGARFRNLSFNIDEDYIKSMWENQKGLCFYTKEPMVFTKGETNKVSIDRLNSNIGYEKDNLVLCEARVNLMKGNLTIVEFKELITKINNNFC